MSNDSTVEQGSTTATTRHQRGKPQRRGRQSWLDEAFVPLVVIGLVIYLGSFSNIFLTTGNLTNLLNQAVILMIVAAGSTFVILAGELDLSVGAGVALVSVLVAEVMLATGSIVLGALAGVGLGIGLGLTNGLLATQLKVPSFIATLGTSVVLRGVALARTDGGIVTGLPDGFLAWSSSSFLGLSFIVWMMIVTVALLWFLQTQTSFGYKVLAVGGNSTAARLAGISVERIKIACFVISGITVTFGGLALTSRVQSGQPNGAATLALYSIAAIVIGGTSLTGGRGSVLRTVWGVLLIVILANGLDLYGVGYDAQQIVIGMVFIGAASADFFRRYFALRRARKTVLRNANAT